MHPLATKLADRYLGAARAKAPVNEDNLELLELVDAKGFKTKGWMSAVKAEIDRMIERNGGGGFDDWFESALENVLDLRSRSPQMETAMRQMGYFEQDPSFEKKWYARTRKQQKDVALTLGGVTVDERDLEVLEAMEQNRHVNGAAWMTWVLDDARSSALENDDQMDESPAGAELYYEMVLSNHFGRSDVYSRAMELMFRYMKSRSFERAWYKAVEALKAKS